MIGTALTFLKGPKVIVGLCVALAFAALFSATLMYRQNSIVAENRLTVVRKQLDNSIKINEENAKAFRRMQLQQEQNDKLLNTLAENYVAVTAATNATQAQLREVAKQNAEVKAYLTTRLPAAVSGLLNAQGARTPNVSERSAAR